MHISFPTLIMHACSTLNTALNRVRNMKLTTVYELPQWGGSYEVATTTTTTTKIIIKKINK